MIKLKRLRWARLRRIVYHPLMRRHERMSEIRKPRRGWEDIKMDVKEIGWEGLGCIYLAWDRDQWQLVVNIVYCRFSIRINVGYLSVQSPKLNHNSRRE
jgi:hypothetical protein